MNVGDLVKRWLSLNISIFTKLLLKESLQTTDWKVDINFKKAVAGRTIQPRSFTRTTSNSISSRPSTT